MNRLTVKDEFGYLPKDMAGTSCDDYCPGDCGTCIIQACFDRLGKLEDMLEAGEKAERTKDTLPGGNIYWINDRGHIVCAQLRDAEGRILIIKKDGAICSKGPALYRSLAEARAALRKMKGAAG